MDCSCDSVIDDVLAPPQVAPGAALLMRILEDFIHLIGEAQKPFQSFLVVTNNLSEYHSVFLMWLNEGETDRSQSTSACPSDNHPERAGVSGFQRYQLSHEGPERDERLGQNCRG